MPDKLHPLALGHRLWAMAMEPTLAHLMRVKSKLTGSTKVPSTVPVKHNRDYPLYDWMTRHNAVLEYNKTHKSDLVWIGDSIAHRFGGPPTDETPPTGQKVWERYYGHRNAVDLGFGYDRTENVLWRIEQGGLDGINPKVVVILIGTNNLSIGSAIEAGLGVYAVVNAVHEKLPQAKILLLGVLPRGEKPDDPIRTKVEELNSTLSALQMDNVTYLDAGKGLVSEDGRISTDMMPDFLHPTEKAYEVIAQNVEKILKGWFPK